ncbi:LEA type 2 family protein [Simiduia curdlanivorans]|uniref:LEA type 2 family protein n=1 Tax=Simiduia curdlanivorans TaxID=1492769 RepID=A0ABV8V4T4_9GAMM|nr:LEA type 2 family protein [Simiduia curdlanivorans]MDN3638193.1 LEA type 2 family protein [Simiduia curdlanivorans]
MSFIWKMSARVLVLTTLFLVACTGLPNALTKPEIKVVSLTPIAAEGFQQRFSVGLRVTNPNSTDIVLRGMSYAIDIGGHDIFSGVSGAVPVLKAYTETPVTVEVSANIMSVIALISDLTKKGPENLQYTLNAKLDVNALLPSISVTETGPVPFLNARSLATGNR